MSVEYHPGDSVVHELNPITVLSVGGCVVLSAFVLDDLAAVSVVLGVVVAAGIEAGVLRQLSRPLAAVAVPLGGSLGFFHGLFSPRNATPLFTVGPVTVWQEGTLFAALTFFRLLVLFLTLYLVVTTVHPKRMTTALVQRGLPSQFAYVYMASITFISELRERSQSILDAQQSRGLDTKASLPRRLRSLVSLLSPLLIGSLVSAQTRALALDARGFNGDRERTYLYDVPDSTTDRLLRWLAVSVTAVVVATQFAGMIPLRGVHVA